MNNNSVNKISEWKEELAGASPKDTLLWTLKTFGKRVKFASSLGLEDQVITDLIAKEVPEIEIFTLDTGRLFKETYELIQKIEDHYKIKIHVYFPNSREVEDMVGEFGVNLFYNSEKNRKLCCGIRKIKPLKRALAGLEAWICGLRQDQSENRTQLEKIEWDKGNNIIRINPLYDWKESHLWEYIKGNNVPYNFLHDQNFPSIGCSCCTRAVKPGEDIRAGRWWWEENEKKECGLHIVEGKIVAPT